MKIMVDGGAGYMGSVFVEEACHAGHEVTVFDSLVEGHRAAVDDRTTFVQRDLADRDACVEAGAKKMVFSSTAAIFGVPDRVPIEEDFPKQLVNAYGESKLMFESLLRWYKEIHGLDYVAFRYFNAAGASPTRGEAHRIETHLIPNVLQVPLGQKENCSIFGTDYDTPDGTCIRDYIHVNEGERRAGDPPRLIASSTRAIEKPGWKPRFPMLEDIVSSAWNWHQSSPNGYV